MPGMVYRVIDPMWKKVWGRNLSWEQAKLTKTKVANKRLSSTVMIEAEDLPCPDGAQENAVAAMAELEADVAQTTGPVAPTPPPPLTVVPPPAPSAGTPAPPVSNIAGMQLKSLQSNAMDVATTAAREANERADAAARRLEYKRQGAEARKEAARLAKEADELAGGDDVSDNEIDDFLTGTSSVPTDDEIAKAKAKAATPQ